MSEKDSHRTLQFEGGGRARSKGRVAKMPHFIHFFLMKLSSSQLQRHRRLGTGANTPKFRPILCPVPILYQIITEDTDMGFKTVNEYVESRENMSHCR